MVCTVPMQVPDSYLEPYSTLSGPRQKLAGMLAAVDEAIGQIVESLEKSGLRENTLIVFSTDNGGPRPGTNTPLRDFKGSLYEGGVRGCAFANWPGKIPAGQRIKEPMHIIDWYPTLVKLAGGSLEQELPIDGQDVWPVLTQQAMSPHNAILSVQTPARAAIRMGDWKLISRGMDGTDSANVRRSKARTKNRQQSEESIELYNLETDIGETTNLASKEPERVAMMTKRLADFLKDAVPSGATVENVAE